METSRNLKLINKKFYRYLITGILMVFALQFGSLADGIIISNFLGPDALSAQTLCYSVIYASQLLANLAAVGVSIVIANFLGRREIEKASRLFTFTIIVSFALMFVFAVVGCILTPNITLLLSGDSGLEGYMEPYIWSYFLMSPIVTIGLILSYVMSSDNNPLLGTLFVIIAQATHVIYQILFATFSTLGMLGQGLSFGLGFLTAFFLIIPYIKSKGRLLTFDFNFKGVWPSLWESIKSGSSAFLFVFLSALGFFIINFPVTHFLNTDGIIVYAVLANIIFVEELFLSSVLQVIPSFIGVLYGEKDFFSIKRIIFKILLILFGVAIVLLGLTLIIPQIYLGIFGIVIEDNAALELALNVIRIYSISFVFFAVNKFISIYYPTILKVSVSNLNTLLKYGLFGISFQCFGLYLWGVIGYSIGTIANEILSLVVTLIYVVIMQRKGKFEKANIFLIKNSNEIQNFYEFSVSNDLKECTLISEKVQNIAKEMTENEKVSVFAGVVTEEITTNIVKYGYLNLKKSNFIDIAIFKNEEEMTIRIRDDGVAFDPTIYKEEESKIYTTSGIELAKKISDNFNYIRVIGTNNTILSLNLNRSEE